MEDTLLDVRAGLNTKVAKKTKTTKKVFE